MVASLLVQSYFLCGRGCDPTFACISQLKIRSLALPPRSVMAARQEAKVLASLSLLDSRASKCLKVSQRSVQQFATGACSELARDAEHDQPVPPDT
jgi:hypothetical protein